MKKAKGFVFILLFLTTTLFSGCRAEKQMKLDPKEPVTLTMWHNYGGEMQQTMDRLIDEFNVTEGMKKGIIINVTAISSSSELGEKLDMIANGDPGAPALPNIFTCYPRTAVTLESKGMIANLDHYFSSNELSRYVPQFLEEGRFADGGLYVFPIAKSTEILFINQTLFDRFAAENDVSMDNFKSFEDIADMAMKYYVWTDDQTPGIKDDGKMFFTADSWLNIAQAGMLQQGTHLFESESFSLQNPQYQKIWNTLYPAFVKGGFAIYDGYSSDLSKIGDIVCSTGSSAGILFYGDTITYPDNTTESVEYNILPFPVFKGGQKYAIQRGNGFCIASSDKTHEYAAACFLKWFTSPENNLRFVFSTGYLPVTNEAFGNRMKDQLSEVKDARIKKMLLAVTKMYTDYTFFVTPTFESFDKLGKEYESSFKKLLRTDRENYLNSISSASPNEQSLMAQNSLNKFITQYEK